MFVLPQYVFFLFFARSICFCKNNFAKRCKNQIYKHSLRLWLKLNNAVNIRILPILVLVYGVLRILLVITYLMAKLNLKCIHMVLYINEIVLIIENSDN